MEVRLLSVGARGFFLAASRLDFAASPLNSVAPNEKKTSGTQGSYPVIIDHKLHFPSVPVSCTGILSFHRLKYPTLSARFKRLHRAQLNCYYHYKQPKT